MREATVYTVLLASDQGFVPDLARQLTLADTSLNLGILFLLGIIEMRSTKPTTAYCSFSPHVLALLPEWSGPAAVVSSCPTHGRIHRVPLQCLNADIQSRVSCSCSPSLVQS